MGEYTVFESGGHRQRVSRGAMGAWLAVGRYRRN